MALSVIVKSSRTFVCSSSGGGGVLAGAGPGAADAGPVPSGDLHSGPVLVLVLGYSHHR